MAENFQQNVTTLFRGMEEFMTSKTVVGQPIYLEGTTILPLVDVSFGVMASSKYEPHKRNGGGGMGGKMSPSAVLVIQNGNTRIINIKNQDGVTKLMDLVPDIMNRFSAGKDPKVEEAVKEAKEESAALAFGAKKKVEGMIQDARAIKELKQGVEDLEALPEVEGSIIFTMEKETLVNSLRGLYLLIDDKRLDDATVEQEIRKVMVKVVPAETGDDTLAADEPKSEEELAIANARNIAYSACLRALDSLKMETGDSSQPQK